jgi:gamma-glutamylcyclotransferase (GGCT)/AIG2-like uncharacterized protein YtfP
MPDHLFVYGTLRKGSAHPFARALHARAEYLGTAYATGLLFDLGRYPGAVFDAKPPGTIVGDAFALPNPDLILALLDAFEGLAEATPYGEYTRQRIAVRARGTKLMAWSYALVEQPRFGRRIRGGDWLRRPLAKSGPGV